MKLGRFFAPAINSGSANLGLLVLRIWLGLVMLMNHGLSKIMKFSELSKDFPDLLHVGSPAVNLALTIFAEAACSILLAIGFLTRFAALTLGITMGVAFFLVHQMKLTGERNGELAFIYLAGYVTLLITGPGRFSLDSVVFAKGTAPK